MSSTLSDKMKTAIHGMEAIREGTETVVSTLATLVKGVNAASGVITLLRSLDRDNDFAWFGLARRRNPLGAVAILGVGVAMGAGLGLLLASMSGADVHVAFRGRSAEQRPRTDAEHRAAEPPVKDATAMPARPEANGTASVVTDVRQG
jgi:hypothetical protein